jgi:ABC-2 type transport system permease protein
MRRSERIEYAARNLRSVGALVSARLAREASEAGSFWSAFIVDTLVFLIQAAVFWIIYLNVDDIGGWDKWKSVFFVGTFTFVDGLYMSLYFFGLLGIPEAIATGRLDLYLAKPFDPLLHLAFERFNPGSLFLSLPALALVAGASTALGWTPSLGSIIAYLGAIVLMLLLMFDLMVLARVPAFRFRRIGAIGAMESALVEFAMRVPASAYRGRLKILFRVILPYGLLAAFPTEVFFGSGGPVLGTWAAAVATTAVFTVIARVAWKRGLDRYEGTGS